MRPLLVCIVFIESLFLHPLLNATKSAFHHQNFVGYYILWVSSSIKGASLFISIIHNSLLVHMYVYCWCRSFLTNSDNKYVHYSITVLFFLPLCSHTSSYVPVPGTGTSTSTSLHTYFLSYSYRNKEILRHE